MKYLALLLMLLFAVPAFADHLPGTYLLTRVDADNLLGGFQAAMTQSPDNRAVDWQNPNTGLSGSTVPTRSYRSAAGNLCRDYLSTVQLNGATQQAFGTACQRSDGSWKIAGEKLVERPQMALKFVYHQTGQQQRLQPCPGGDVKWSVPKARFHSDRFHEEIKIYQRQQKMPQQPQQVEPRPPSRLLKLVAY